MISTTGGSQPPVCFPCPYCGFAHSMERCSRISEIEYENGLVKRVRFWNSGTWYKHAEKPDGK